MKTLNVLKISVFIFIVVIFNFKVLSFNLPSVSAQSRLTYPIVDLGYCRDAKECYLYCEIPENKAACWSYGKYKVGNDVLGVTTMSAEEKQMMESKARKYNVTFPITDLGGCANPQECRDFCEQPANQTACMDFAKKKGFDKEMERPPEAMDPQKRDELLEKAKSELGCTSMESCKNICESDHTRCESFAKKHGVYQEPPETQGRYSVQEKQNLIQKAQSELGCTSMESCKSTCEQYPERCMAFAKKHGFDDDRKNNQGNEEQSDAGRRPEDLNQYQQGAPSGISPNLGSQRFGKGGCDSEESCKKYCQEHPDECPGFQGYTRATQSGLPTTIASPGKQSQGSYVGPSGCRNEAECENWCKGSPDKCPGFREGKTREEQTKREYELKKKQMELNQETQKRQFETNREVMQKRMEQSPTNIQRYDDDRSPNPSTFTQPPLNAAPPVSGDYTNPFPAQPITP